MARKTLLLLLICVPVVPVAVAVNSDQGSDAFFSKRIAPILQQRCLECHNPTRSKGGLDLSTRELLLAGGDKGPAIIPGNAEKSLLFQQVHGNPPRMPKKGEPLATDQVADLRRWIDDGAAWPKGLKLAAKPAAADETWWSLQPLNRPQIPLVKNLNWARTPIDYFILAKLEANELPPTDEIDRAGFIRRATFDLHGLPPTPEEIAEFVKDASPIAFEKLIDRLLASPRYGERWGRYWLDIIHYADTHGYDKDKKRLWAWLFRDWIIRALNRDMPYRRFVRYQLAGDVLYPEDPDGIIATGFIAAGPWDFVGHVELREGTVDKEKTRLLDRDDMVASTISTFCSLTAHCARCHDHKFDPIPQKEYYRLQAVFAGVERGDRDVFQGEQAQQQRALTERLKELTAQLDGLQKKIDTLQTPELHLRDWDIAKLRARLQEFPPLPDAKPSPSNGWHSAIAPKPDMEKWVQIDLGKTQPIDLIRLVPARPTDFADTPGFGFPVRFRVAIAQEPTFSKSETVADHTQTDYPSPGDTPVEFRLAGKQARYVRVTATRLWKRTNDYVFALAELQVESKGKNIARGGSVTARDSIEAGRWSRKYLIDNFSSRWQMPDLENPKARERLALQNQLSEALAQRRKLAENSIDAATLTELARTAKLIEASQQELKTVGATQKVYATIPIKPRPIHFLQRGDVERKGELVTAGSLSLLPDLPGSFMLKSPDAEGERRAALADWITHDRNVLTWRSIVNRVWQSHFGKGLVDTPNDFGRNGSKPSHPELLDWLAVEFRDGDQSLKKLHKMIMLSAAYRQASTHHDGKAKIDADNRYLWRMNRQRLDAEAIRDSVLAISGKLKHQMYGPGFEQFRFKDDHSPIYDHLDLTKANHPDTWRRTVYRFAVRSVPNPFLESLDCADPNINTPVRNTTLTALQALALLNNPFMVKQAEFFAERVRQQTKEPERQVETAYLLAFGRRPNPREQEQMAGYIRRHGLANACRLVFNANEFLFVD